tara:strand:+ start:1694 stop:2671 length:978 start_codon:yes stop_codon:yes gene_type:complete
MVKLNYISVAKNAAKIQIAELKKINKVFDRSFIKAVELIASSKGKIICAGIGKSGLIARKISATLSSVGVPSFFCDPAQALHGDMGQIEKKDILLIFSYSGNTAELTNMLRYANRFNIKIIGVASKEDSLLLKASDVKIILPKVKEAGLGSIVPTTSTSITLMLGDCLATSLMYKKKFSREKFKVFHPGGNIGQTLLLAKDIMLRGKKLPVIDINKNLKNALKEINAKKLGMVVVLKKNCVVGIITDGDLRREIKYFTKSRKLEKVMTKKPLFVNENTPASKALSIMNEKKITSLIVTSNKKRNKSMQKLNGIIHIHSLLKYGLK